MEVRGERSRPTAPPWNRSWHIRTISLLRGGRRIKRLQGKCECSSDSSADSTQLHFTANQQWELKKRLFLTVMVTEHNTAEGRRPKVRVWVWTQNFDILKKVYLHIYYSVCVWEREKECVRERESERDWSHSAFHLSAAVSQDLHPLADCHSFSKVASLCLQEVDLQTFCCFDRYDVKLTRTFLTTLPRRGVPSSSWRAAPCGGSPSPFFLLNCLYFIDDVIHHQ